LLCPYKTGFTTGETMTEDQLEQETIGWLADTGYSHCYGLEIAPDGSTPERSSWG
jgi:type I restriction enzyme R subunit